MNNGDGSRGSASPPLGSPRLPLKWSRVDKPALDGDDERSIDDKDAIPRDITPFQPIESVEKEGVENMDGSPVEGAVIRGATILAKGQTLPQMRMSTGWVKSLEYLLCQFVIAESEYDLNISS